MIRALSTMANISYNWLGASGIKVSNICLGTMLFGDHPQGRPSCPEPDAHKVLDRFAELGGNFIDTADMYHNGQSEEIIGRWLTKQDRNKFVIASKCGRPCMDVSNVNCRGASRRHLIWSVDQCLKRLQTDYVDIFYIHVWDQGAPLHEQLSAMNYLLQSGKVRYLAMSNAKGWQMQKIVEMSKQKNWEPFVCLQNQYSLLCRSPEWEVIEVCENEGLGFLPWSPLKGGWMSGKIKSDSKTAPEGSRIAWSQEEKGRAHHSHPDFDWFAKDGHAFSVLTKVEEIAKKHEVTVPQVAIRWLLQKPFIPSVVIGPRTIEQMEDSVKATTWSLSPEEMKELDDVSTIPSPYPYDYIPAANAGRERKS